MFGLGRYGGRLLAQLKAEGVDALGVDFDPQAVRELHARGLPVRYGDGEDPDFLESLPLSRTRWVVSSLPQWESNRALLHALRVAGFRGEFVGAARDAAHGRALAAAGVKQVLHPFDDGADHAARRIAGLLRETRA